MREAYVVWVGGLNHTPVVNHLRNCAAQFVAEPRCIEVSALDVRLVNGLMRAVVENHEIGGSAIDPFGRIQAQNSVWFGNHGTQSVRRIGVIFLGKMQHAVE